MSSQRRPSARIAAKTDVNSITQNDTKASQATSKGSPQSNESQLPTSTTSIDSDVTWDNDAPTIQPRTNLQRDHSKDRIWNEEFDFGDLEGSASDDFNHGASEGNPTPAAEANGDSETDSDDESEENGPKFTLFPKLPVELRRKILKDVCFIPRVIDLWCRDAFKDGEEWEEEFTTKIYPMAFEYLSHSGIPPAILHA